MSIFDKNLIQKELPLEDMFREKIVSISNNIVHHINEASAHGIYEFSRVTEPGSYGPYDRYLVWIDRYDAFSDYLTFAIKQLQEDLNHHPIIHNKKSVLIDNMLVFSDITQHSVFGDIYDDGRRDKNPSVLYKVNIEYTLRSGIFPSIYAERSLTTISFDVSLDPPQLPQEPTGKHSSLYHTIW